MNTIVITIKDGLPWKVEASGPDAVQIFFRDLDMADIGGPVKTEQFFVESLSKATLKTIPK